MLWDVLGTGLQQEDGALGQGQEFLVQAGGWRSVGSAQNPGPRIFLGMGLRLRKDSLGRGCVMGGAPLGKGQ